MAELRVLSRHEFPNCSLKVIQAGESKILLINDGGKICAVQSECPHAGAPLEQGAVVNHRLTCPWHLATFELPGGELVEPPAMDSLKIFPVRFDGDDILVETESQSPRGSTCTVTSRNVYVLIGAGAAGAMAAKTLRNGGFCGRIVAIDPVADEPVDRTQLSKDALGGNVSLEQIKLNAFADLSVECIRSSIISLDAQKQELRLADGKVLQFDKALLATGANPQRLPIPGAERAYTIRHSQDVQNILRALTDKSNVVIIGSGYIALEAASALVQRGLSVTVAARDSFPFVKQFGPDAARVLTTLHKNNGTVFRLGAELLSISNNSVTLSKNGFKEILHADLVLMGVGVTPTLTFHHDLPLDRNGGIKTDSSLKAADAVWVAGDIASIHGQRIEHWRVAQQHGRIAAMGMLGHSPEPLGVPYFWTYHFGKRFGYLGHASEWDETFNHGDLEGDNFMVFYIKTGLVKAVLNCGLETQMAALAEPMRQPLSLSEALRRIQ